MTKSKLERIRKRGANDFKTDELEKMVRLWSRQNGSPDDERETCVLRDGADLARQELALRKSARES